MMRRVPKKSLASKANKRVWVQTRQSLDDGEGGFTETWVDTVRTWASIYPIQAKQRFEYNTINVHATHHIELRGAVSVDDETNRIKWDSRYFEILTAEDIQEKGVKTFLTCKEIR